MASTGKDPIELWQAMLGQMEKGFSAFANQAMASADYNKVVNEVNGASAGAKKQLGELMERYLVSMNLPSREQLTAFGERLQAIELQLQEIAALLRQSERAAPVAEVAAAAAEVVAPPAEVVATPAEVVARPAEVVAPSAAPKPPRPRRTTPDGSRK